MNNIKNFTIIIPCVSYKDVKKCIIEIRKQYKKIKIIVCLNKITTKIKRDKNLKFVVTKTESIAQKRNIAVNLCKSKYLAFLDSDAYPAKNWIESTYKFFKKNKNLIVAGPHMDPPIQTNVEKVIGLIKKSTLITMKPKLQKDNCEKEQYVSFFPSVNWILPKKIFNIMGQMDGKLMRNEDWDFIYRMRKKKFRLFYSPKTLVYHENGNLSHFIKKRFKYGYHMWPVLVNLNFENYYFFIPLFFTLFLISFPMGFLIGSYFFLYFAILIFYFFVMLLESIKLCDKLQNFIKIFTVLIMANISPGFGILFGLVKFLKLIK